MAKRKQKIEGMALSQIIVLLIGTIAFAYLMGQIGIVGAQIEESLPQGVNLFPSSIVDIPGAGINLPAMPSPFPLATNPLNLNPFGLNPNLFSAGPPVTPASPPPIPEIGRGPLGFVGDWLNSIGSGPLLANIGEIVASAAVAAAVYIGLSFLEDKLGIQQGSVGDYWYGLAQFGTTAFTFGALSAPALSSIFQVGISGLTAGGIMLIPAIIAYLAFFKHTKQNAAAVSCIPWRVPKGGNACGECGQNGLRCTNYQCTSLGQGCKLLPSTSGKPVCTWIDERDITPPTITFMNEVLPAGYTTTPLSSTYPGGTGVLIQSDKNGGKIPPGTILNIGIKTDKISDCKYDTVLGDNFTTMSSVLTGGIDGTEDLNGFNHTISIPIFQPAQSGGTSVQTSGQVDYYFRCENANGFADVNAFDVQFVVDSAPDKTAPEIVGTNILSGSPVPFGTTSANIKVYVRDQSGVSGCQWSRNNYAYGSMENNMTCSNTINLQGVYAGTFTCLANLTGIKDRVENDFYFACNDTVGNVAQALQYSLRGTQPLVISSVNPINGSTIQDSTQNVKVTLNVQTTAGSDQGQATCSWSPSGNPGTYFDFINTNSYQSTHNLSLYAGSYNYYIKCVDPGGNAAYSSTKFNVQSVTTPPNVVRASRDGTNLNIQTNIQSTCVYDVIDCTYPFNEGTSMTTTNGLTHSTSWVAGRTYYIKCKDNFENQPDPNSCSIVLSPSSV